MICGRQKHVFHIKRQASHDEFTQPSSRFEAMASDIDPLLVHADSGDFDAVKRVLEESDTVSKRLKLRDVDKRTVFVSTKNKRGKIGTTN